MTKFKFGWFFLALVVVALDLLSKSWVSNNLHYHDPWVLTSFFNLMLTHNEGAAFSFLSDAGGWQRWFFAAIATVFSVVIIVWMLRLKKESWRELLALSFILGGAIGNLYDRVSLGYVVDFLVVHYNGYTFPAFNLADSAICLGAFVLILDAFLVHKEQADG